MSCTTDVEAYLADCCVEGQDRRVLASDLYDAYKKWGGDLSRQRFYHCLKLRGFKTGRDPATRRIEWRDLGLLSNSGGPAMTQMFTDWLMEQKKRQDPVGDLARDVDADSTWPAGATLAELYDYLEMRGACDGALEALKRAWHEWRVSSEASLTGDDQQVVVSRYAGTPFATSPARNRKNVTTEELELREALSLVLTGQDDSDVTELGRPMIVTPYEGAYGRAGVVIAINGSPPRGLLLVTTDRGPRDACVFVIRRPYQPGPVITLGRWDRMTKKKQRLYRAVIAYLESQSIWVDGYSGGEPCMNGDDAWVLYFDGACEPRNPGGIACYGWLVKRDGATLASGHGEVARGPGATNNVAEYAALIAGLEALIDLDPGGEPVRVRGDSRLAINQVAGRWQVKSPNLRPLHERARSLVRRLQDGGCRVTLRWVPRDQNAEADALSREAYRAALQSGGAIGLL